MKRVFTAILVVAMLFAFAGCSGKEETADIQTIMKTIRSDIDLPDMADITKERVTAFYEVNTEDIKDMVCIMAGSGATADEIFIAEMTDKDKTADMKTALEDRKAQQIDLFKTYNPSENDKLENCVIEVKGAYVFMAICNDNTKAKKIFTDAF